MEESNLRASVAAIGAAFLLAWAGLAAAASATWLVANNGDDVAGCGVPLATPCRSISQAISLAAAGDTIIVGPGIYGDLDLDGNLGGAGEELGPTVAVNISKSLTVVSSHGANSTIIDAAGVAIGVAIVSANTTFGKANKGFTVRNAANAGISDTAPQPGIKIRGNIVVGAVDGIVVSSDDAMIQDNRVSNASGAGIHSSASGVTLQGNAASANAVGMRMTPDNLIVRKNVAVGNDTGMELDFVTALGTALFSSNTISGNRDLGLVVTGATGVAETLAGNNLYGNGDAAMSPLVTNCGVAVINTGTLTVTADGNFWGAAAPGPNPADYATCATGGSSPATALNPAATEFNVRLKPIR